MDPLLVGAAEVDITPNVGLPLAGYSTDGNSAIGVRGHLFARALYLEDADGEKVAFCIADLHSGTRYLLERAAALTSSSCGVTVDRLVLCGTHTHTGPGNIYGNSLYDSLAQPQSGLDVELADWLASRIALAVEQAEAGKESALVGMADRSLWGIARNRSLTPFLENPDPVAWNAAGAPGEGCPTDLSEERCKVDPRISVLTAVREEDRQLFGVLAFFGCHTTTLGMAADYYAPDWAGYACRKARRELERSTQGRHVVVAVGLSGAGDVNALRDDLERPWTQGTRLARSVGARLGMEIATASRAARRAATSVSVSALYAEPTTAEGAAHPEPGARLAGDWMIGASTLGGAEDGRSVLFRLGLSHEGMTDDSTPQPQHPKAQAAGPLLDVIRFLLDLDPGPVLPVHAVRVGDRLFVTVPGEPTTHGAHDIERAVQAKTGAARVTVIGYAGDYMGYFPTPQEYDLQHYEGASAIFGRNSTRHIAARLEELLAAGHSGPLLPRPIAFDGDTRTSRFQPPEQLICENVDPEPQIERRRNHIHVQWQMDWEDLVPFALEWFVRVESKASSAWLPLHYMARDFDDVYAFIHIERDGSFRPGGKTRWHARLNLPPRSDEQAPLSVRVNRRGDFQGFRVQIPPRA